VLTCNSTKEKLREVICETSKHSSKMTVLVDNYRHHHQNGHGNMTEQQMSERIKKMGQLDSIETAVVEVMMSIKNETGVISEKEFLFLQDKLEKFHFELDKVETMGDEEVRKKRKSLAALVTAIFKLLDAKANKLDEDQAEDEQTDTVHDTQTHSSDNVKDTKEDEEAINIKLDHPTQDQKDDSHAEDTSPDEANNEENLEEEVEDLDPKRAKISVFEHKVVTMIDLSDISTKDLAVKVENDELLVRGGGWILRRRLPPNCLTDRTMAQLSHDGVLFVNIPRRRNLYHRRNLPFWF